MAQFKSDIVNRIKRFPKPHSATDALQPIFEAISNSIHSLQNKFEQEINSKGKILIEFQVDKGRENIEVFIKDNGVGLDSTNWDAFLTTDTAHKISKGGKGVGRLLWLDCFSVVKVVSTFIQDNNHYTRSFRFKLDNAFKINDEVNEDIVNETGFEVKFEGLIDNGYKKKFPVTLNTIKNHFESHFMPLFVGTCPKITLVINQKRFQYPSEINNVIKQKSKEIEITDEELGSFQLISLECLKQASSDLKGKHFIHYIAHERTVLSQCIDGILGIGYYGENKDRVYHAVLKGKYLDKHVNQERTDFTFSDKVIEKITKDVCFEEIAKFLKEPIKIQRKVQKELILEVAGNHPSIAFSNIDELQEKIPTGLMDKEKIYSNLSVYKYRRVNNQKKKLEEVFKRLKNNEFQFSDFEKKVKEASDEIAEEKRRSLAEYVVRRKATLDFLSKITSKLDFSKNASGFENEAILHSMICPIRTGTLTSKIEPTAHDLWIIDERLAFAEYFASDQEFKKILNTDSSDRSDILVFDQLHGLKQEATNTVLIIEFKKPGKDQYIEKDYPDKQIWKYIKQLQNNDCLDIYGKRVKIDKSTVFNCYFIADLIGDLKDHTEMWDDTPNKDGKFYFPRNGFNGFIEIIEWQTLIQRAQDRNKAFFEKVGLEKSSLVK